MAGGISLKSSQKLSLFNLSLLILVEKPKVVFQAWSNECWAEGMIPSHKLLSLLLFPWGWVQNTSFPSVKDSMISTPMIFQRQRMLLETWDAEKLVPEACLAKIHPTLLKLFQLQAALESCSCALHPAHGYNIPTSFSIPLFVTHCQVNSVKWFKIKPTAKPFLRFIFISYQQTDPFSQGAARP